MIGWEKMGWTEDGERRERQPGGWDERSNGFGWEKCLTNVDEPPHREITSLALPADFPHVLALSAAITIPQDLYTRRLKTPLVPRPSSRFRFASFVRGIGSVAGH